MKLTKFDVAERQINQAVSLFFNDGDAISIHTLSEAAGQILYDIREQFGGKSFVRDSDLIREDRKVEWFSCVFKSRNFFKHADRDPAATHEFNETINHFSMLDSVNMLQSAKGCWTPETLVYLSWFAFTYPYMLNTNGGLRTLVEQWQHGEGPINPGHRPSMAILLRELRSGSRAMPNVSLSLGQASDG